MTKDEIHASGIGVIENRYCGDDDIWMFPVVAIQDTFIPKGICICQFHLVKQGPDFEFEQVERLW